MQAEELKAAINLIIEEAYNKGNLEVLDEHVASDFVYHIVPYPDIEGLEARKQFIKDIRSAYPDLKLTVEEMIVEGETLAFRWTFQGTHTGQSPILDIAPTGKQVTQTGCSLVHWAEGKVVEVWGYLDHLGLLHQLGFELVPPQEEGKE